MVAINADEAAEALGRAAAMSHSKAEQKGVSLAILHVAGEFAARDPRFSKDEFRAKANESFARHKAQHERTLAAANVLAKFGKEKGNA